jgi:hypothetical protein
VPPPRAIAGLRSAWRSSRCGLNSVCCIRIAAHRSEVIALVAGAEKLASTPRMNPRRPAITSCTSRGVPSDVRTESTRSRIGAPRVRTACRTTARNVSEGFAASPGRTPSS